MRSRLMRKKLSYKKSPHHQKACCRLHHRQPPGAFSMHSSVFIPLVYHISSPVSTAPNEELKGSELRNRKSPRREAVGIAFVGGI